MKTFTLFAALMLAANAVSAAGSHAGGHGEHMAIGEPGDAAKVDRVIEITMTEPETGGMLFSPSQLEVKKGETIRFVVRNEGELEHEIVFDTAERNHDHKAMMEKFPEMEHDDPNAVRLEPGAEGEIVWRFSNAGTFEFACLIPGHFEAGMNGPIIVN